MFTGINYIAMKKIFLLPALFIFAFTTNSFAQFEGKITYTLQEKDNSGEQGQEQFTTYFTPNRIFIESDEAMKMAGSFKTEGLLIRLDKNDFVFLTGDKTAMSISKAGITSFMNMFSEMNKQDESDVANEIEKDYMFKQTGETKNINGYKAYKFVLKSKDEENKKGIIWMTKQIDINWGMLAEPWGDSVNFLTSKDLPTGYIFQKGWLPLKGTFYEEGEVSGQMTAKVEETDVSQSMVQLSSDMQVKNLSEYLFKMMRKRN